MPLSPPESILVRAPNWIGDQVLAYPFFHHLRKSYPRAHIGVSCVQWVAELQFRNLVDETFILQRPGSDTFLEKLGVIEFAAKTVRSRRQWDLAITLPNSLSSAWFLYRSGARRRRGYGVEGRRLLLNESMAWDGRSSIHRAQAYLDLLPSEARPARAAQEFWGILPENDLDPGVPGELAHFPVEKAWPGFEQIEPPAEPFWVLAPGSTAESRRWPIPYFVTLARRIRQETGWRGVVVGGPKEAPLAEELCRDSTLGLRDLVARGPVPSLAKVFQDSKFTVTNESGLAHVAALCGSFVQIVCGAADPKRTTPLGPGRVRVAINPVECWPCERNTCSQPAGLKLQCLRGIEPEMVWEEIKRGIRLRP